MTVPSQQAPAGNRSRLAPVLMVQGTASSAGKSTLVAGLCRLFSNRGIRVAPFKAQNMSNNAAVCRDGGEIGRAQFAQAVAARVEPTVDMNPILLKPQGGNSQVVVRGQVQGVQSARDYFRKANRQSLWPVVADALDRLRSEYDLVIVEGAGSPAEINLRDRDIVNMRVALHANADVLLVADIDRGGAFASLLGTWEWLDPAERALVRGFVLNKFRGDAALLSPAPELLQERTGVPVVGVVPFTPDLHLPEEDAATLASSTSAASASAAVEIAVIRLPHIANFDEFAPLAAEPRVHVRYVSQPDELRAPDLIILPGTKTTIPDLQWLQSRGLADRVRWLVARGTPVLGICGGYQMLGSSVVDPGQLESEQTRCDGLGLVEMETELTPEKRLTRVSPTFQANLPGIWRTLGGLKTEGYEIHLGRTPDAALPLLNLDPDNPASGPSESCESGRGASRTPEVGGDATGMGDPGAGASGVHETAGWSRSREIEAGSRARASADGSRLQEPDKAYRADVSGGGPGAYASDGAVSADGLIAGTYIHGLFEQSAPRHALVAALAEARGFDWSPSPAPTEDPYDHLARLLEDSLDLSALRIPSLTT